MNNNNMYLMSETSKEHVKENSISNFQTQEDLEVRKEKYYYMRLGFSLIKPELHEKWIEHVDEFLYDKNDKLIFDISLICLESLKNNVSYEAITNIFDELLLTPDMKNKIVSKLTYFSPNGKEFKEYWNKSNPDNQPKEDYKYKII